LASATATPRTDILPPRLRETDDDDDSDDDDDDDGTGADGDFSPAAVPGGVAVPVGVPPSSPSPTTAAEGGLLDDDDDDDDDDGGGGRLPVPPPLELLLPPPPPPPLASSAAAAVVARLRGPRTRRPRSPASTQTQNQTHISTHRRSEWSGCRRSSSARSW
jgi:hypothetical protein